jgi:starvation-inducible DNA-binding protein
MVAPGVQQSKPLRLRLAQKKENSFMHSTKNDLSEKVRTQMSGVLQDRLAESIDLMLQAKQAHWNVKGPSFMALHELFDKISEETEEYVDLIAERIVQFGGTAEGTLQVVAKRSKLQEYPLSISAGNQHVEALSRALAYYGSNVRRAIDQATELKDAATADIFTEISRGADKWLWFVEAHHQSGA